MKLKQSSYVALPAYACCLMSHTILSLVLQGHSAEVQQLKDVVTKQDKEAVTRQGLADSLQKQLAEASSQVSSLTMNLEATQSHHNAVQVLLQL